MRKDGTPGFDRIVTHDHDRFSQGGWEPQEAHDMIRDILQAHEVLP